MNRYRVDPNVTAARRYLAKCQWDNVAYHVHADTREGIARATICFDWTTCSDDACEHPTVTLPTMPNDVIRFHTRRNYGTIYRVGRAGELAIVAVTRG